MPVHGLESRKPGLAAGLAPTLIRGESPLLISMPHVGTWLGEGCTGRITAPTKREIRQRTADWWDPYHLLLASELERIVTAQGHAVLLDAHSIRGELPWLFEGELPDMNIGTLDAVSCLPGLRKEVEGVFAAQRDYRYVLDGRFKGGFVTRRYGASHAGVHAVQLEMRWRTCMHESPPCHFDTQRAQALHPLLERQVQTLLAWQPG